MLCGSALDHIGVQPLLDAVTYYLPSPADVPPVEGVNPKKNDAKETRKPEPRRAVLRPGVQDRRRQARRPALRARLLRRAEGQQPRRCNPGKDKKENVPQLWHIQADRREQVPSGRGGRHRRRHRPAAFDHRRHAVRSAAPDPAGVDPVSRDGHLDGHRAGELGRAQEAGRRAGDAEAAGSDVPRPGKRRDRPDADQRHGRAAPGSHQAPPAARLQPERARPQAARQLPRDGRARGRSRPASATASRAGSRCSPKCDPHGAVSAGRQPAPWSCRRAATCCPSRICRRCIDVLTEQGPRRRAARLPADESQDHGAGRRGARDRVERDRLPLSPRPTPSTRACRRPAPCCWSRS